MKFEKNIHYKNIEKMSPWRKISIASWGPKNDSTVYGSFEIEVDKVITFLDDYNEKHNTKITLTHYIGKVVAKVLEENDQINSVIRFGQIYKRQNIDIFFQVATNDTENLSGHVIKRINQKSLDQISEELNEESAQIKSGNEKRYKEVKTLMGHLSPIIIWPILRLLSFIMYDLNIWHKRLKSPQDPYGSIMITSIGSLGLEEAYPPLPSVGKVPMVLAIGKAIKKPRVVNDKIEIKKVIKICTTFDHRLMDGIHAAKFVSSFHKYLNKLAD